MPKFSDEFEALARKEYPNNTELHAAFDAGKVGRVYQIITDINEADRFNYGSLYPAGILEMRKELGDAGFFERIERAERIERVYARMGADIPEEGELDWAITDELDAEREDADATNP
ncbi:MAG: hypothetical protein ABA06_02190 [Parcubacteria bacterium C7867-001]|nr:MAG: hypothetical protein ABA06_02190 [Parcubacteria bacterium C7867-001]